jgi:hypothetical protein
MMERYVTAKIEFVNNNNSDNGGTQQKLKHRWGVTTKLKKKTIKLSKSLVPTKLIYTDSFGGKDSAVGTVARFSLCVQSFGNIVL